VKLSLPGTLHRAVIFDCDGTLVDSMPLHHRAWRAAFAEHGASFDFSWSLFMSRAGKGLGQTVVELNEQFSEQLDPQAVVVSQRRYYQELLPELEPLAPVVEYARKVAGKMPLAVASGGEKEMVVGALEAVGIRQLFDHVVCQVDVERGKPWPDMFLLCAERMNVEPAECLVFEDGELGILAAKAAGMSWVAVDGSGRCSDDDA
jgi:HAD superfamily hydrolase (TIGR01509 family)